MKKQINKKISQIKFKNNGNKKYIVKIIYNSTIYAK